MVLAALLAISLLQPNDSLPHFTATVSVQLDVDQLQVDVLDNVYVLTGNTLRKYSPKGKEICFFVDNNLGTPASVDCSDPMNIQLFYPDQNKLVYLDRTLSQLESTISLDGISGTAPLAVCNSSREAFWILNKQQLRLQCYNRNFELLIQSQPLTDIVRTNSVCKLSESENQLLLLVKGKGVYLFDRFGGLQRFFPEPKAEMTVLRGNVLFISTINELFQINPLSGKKTAIPNRQTGMFVFPLSGKLYVDFTPNGFSLLRLNE